MFIVAPTVYAGAMYEYWAKAKPLSFYLLSQKAAFPFYLPKICFNPQ